METYLSSHWPYLIPLIGALALLGALWLSAKLEKRIFRFLYKRRFLSDYIRQRAADMGMDEAEMAAMEIEGWSSVYPELAAKRVVTSSDQNLKSEWDSELQRELAKLPVGQVLFNPPAEMKAGIRYRIEVRVSRDTNVDLTEKLKGSGIPEIEKLKIAERLRVNLLGLDFFIQDLNLESQVIGDDGFTQWAWDVTPLKAGELELMLRVSLRVRLPYGEESKDHPVIERTIKVKSNLMYAGKVFLQKHWKWVITALILPVIGWAVKMMLS